jgi:predicted ABC-type ATPase
MLTVVIGPCCAGKSTYVASKRAADDVVIDVDALCEALGARDPRRAVAHHRLAALKARDAVVAHATGQPYDTWLIHSKPSQAQVAAYSQAGHAVIVVDPGMDECLRRAQSDKRPRWTADAIAEWYDDRPMTQGADTQAAAPSREW